MNAALAKVIHDADYWRGASQSRIPGAQDIPYKEWQHFVVFHSQWVLVFNLNIDRIDPLANDSQAARVITIFSANHWAGQVEQCATPDLERGEISAKFGSAGMEWRNGGYEIWQHDGDVKLHVTLEPASIPSLTHNIPLGTGSHISWCLVPRLIASGWVETGGERIKFENLGAYHDHNWGRFYWGGDFSWEWGAAVPKDPAEPWTLVYARMNSKNRNAITATSVFLLERGKHIRYFRNAEVEFTSGDEYDPHIVGRIPAAAALLLPDQDLDVPTSTTINARRGEDWLTATVRAHHRGQVLVPSEVDYCNVVRLNEASAEVNVFGRCAGRNVAFSGPGLLEIVRA